MSIWKVKLNLEFPQYKFCIILTFNGEDIILRFHIIRESEDMWLEPDLEKYEEPIMIELC